MLPVSKILLFRGFRSQFCGGFEKKDGGSKSKKGPPIDLSRHDGGQ
jgi:hypothetical protein